MTNDPTQHTPRHPAPAPAPAEHLGASVRLISALTGTSRVFGLARDVALGLLFGDRAIASVFAGAFVIPNLFRRLFGEGALSAAFLPEYTAAMRQPEVAHRFACAVSAGVLLITGVLALLLELVFAALLLLSGPDQDTRDFLVLAMVMVPYMPMVCSVAVLGAVLQAHGRFGPTAGAPIVLNLAMIAAAVTAMIQSAEPLTGALVVSVGVVLAGVVQLLWHARALRGALRFTRQRDGIAQHVRATTRRFVPALLGLGTVQINTFLDTLIAMYPIWIGATVLGVAYPLDDKSNGLLFFSQRLYQFPLGVFGIAVATAVFPLLARLASSDDRDGFAGALVRGLRLSIFIGVPAGVGLAMVRADLLRALFPNFSPEGIERASGIVLGYAAGVWAYGVNQVLIRGFYARNDTRTPMRVSLLAVVLNLTLNLALIWPMREAGMAWSTSACAMLQTVVLGFLLVRCGALGTAHLRALLPTIWWSVGLSALMAGGVIALLWALDRPDGWTGALIRVAAASLAGLLVYLGMSAALRREELRWLVRRG